MGSKEVPLQHDMFNDELVDNRTAKQKRRDTRLERQAEKEASLPPPLFSGSEIIQFGVTKVNPALPFAPASALIGLKPEDNRTQEETEHEIQRAAEERTYKMFEDEETPVQLELPLPDEDKILYQAGVVARLAFPLI